MGLGPQYVLDKGHVATGSAAYKFGELVTASGDGTKCARATVAGAKLRGVCQENVDAAKVLTGKVVLDVRMLGISRVIAGAAVAVEDRLTNDTSARAVPVSAVVGAKEYFGIAMTAATGAGEMIDVLLVPYSNINTAVS
jgi:hypothetical protein